MARTRRLRRSYAGGLTEIWPGFVDALAALLVVVIFVLLVFMVSQFYLSNMLSGRDQLVGELSDQINELADLLDLAREESEELRDNNARINAELRGVMGERDSLVADVEEQVSEVARLTDQLGTANQRIEQLELDRQDLDASLADAFQTIEADKETLELRLTELASLQADVEALRAAREQLEIDIATAALARQVLEEDLARLESALSDSEQEEASLRAMLETSQQTIEADAEELRRRAAALAQIRSELEQSQEQLTQRDEALQAAQALVLQTETQLSERDETLASTQSALAESQSQLSDQQEELLLIQGALEAANRLLADKDQTVSGLVSQVQQVQAALAERAATASELEQTTETLLADLLLSREDRQRLLAEMGNIRDRSTALESELADEQERTVLAQRQIEERDIRIEQLLIALDQTEAALDDEIELTTESKALVAQLSAQVDLLNEQLSDVQAALDASEANVSERDIEIADLNSRLNQALIRRVEELARYRSEFFGRLRLVLGQRSDVRVVGDRFVFQSEVLFDTGSATLAPEGRRQLADLAATLLELIEDLPEDIDWILRVDGHTDVRPIFSTQFRSNWELSAARAIEVVEFLITQGLEADRLAAAGFGQYQPLDPAQSEDAYRRNRRIELKFDQK